MRSLRSLMRHDGLREWQVLGEVAEDLLRSLGGALEFCNL